MNTFFEYSIGQATKTPVASLYEIEETNTVMIYPINEKAYIEMFEVMNGAKVNAEMRAMLAAVVSFANHAYEDGVIAGIKKSLT